MAPRIPEIKKSKPDTQTPFELFCKSDDAPQGIDYMAADGSRCDVAALQAARLAAWRALETEAQEAYGAMAVAISPPSTPPESVSGEESTESPEAGDMEVDSKPVLFAYVSPSLPRAPAN